MPYSVNKIKQVESFIDDLRKIRHVYRSKILLWINFNIYSKCHIFQCHNLQFSWMFCCMLLSTSNTYWRNCGYFQSFEQVHLFFSTFLRIPLIDISCFFIFWINFKNAQFFQISFFKFFYTYNLWTDSGSRT